MMRLSDIFNGDVILKDGEFETLGPTETRKSKTLVYCDTVHYVGKALKNDNISCVLTTEELAEKALGSNKGIVCAQVPRNAFYQLHLEFVEQGLYDCEITPFRGENISIHPSAQVSEKSSIGDNVKIGQNVVIYDNVTIGNNSSIDAGAIIGCNGLLYLHGPPPLHITHGGGVIIGRNVSILANAVIVKSVHDTFLTSIGDHCIIGIHCNIGHEAHIENNSILSSGCIVARGARLSEGTFLGPGSILREYVNVGQKAGVKLGSVVIDNIPSHGVVSGSFARDHLSNMREYAVTRRKDNRKNDTNC